MKKIAVMAAMAFAVVLAGCATKPAISVNQLQSGQPYWNTTDASARGVVVLPRPDGKGMQVCAEPSPDAMLQTVASLTAQVQAQNANVDAQTQVEFSTAVVELTQRTQTIVFLREVMYRMCEQGVNQNLTTDQTMQLFQMAMQTALKMAEADLAKNQAQTVRALQDPKVQKMWDQLVNNTPPPAPSSPGGIATGTPGAGAVPKTPSVKR